MKHFDFVTLGEILIDFTPDGFSPEGFPRFIRNPGGAVVTAAAAFAKYGGRPSSAKWGTIFSDASSPTISRISAWTARD